MKKKRFIIGLTGGYGTGKTTVLAEFKRLGAAVFSADAASRSVMRPGGPAYRGVVKAFGTADRKKLAGIVFSDPRRRRQLERITHPAIKKALKSMISRAPKARHVVVEAPLLFEAKIGPMFDYVITVKAPLSSVKRRSKLAPAEAAARAASQMPLARKAALSDAVIDNSRGKKAAAARVKTIWHNLTK